MDNEEGFYLIQGNQVVAYSPNSVYGPGFELHSNKETDKQLTINGWRWYDTNPTLSD